MWRDQNEKHGCMTKKNVNSFVPKFQWFSFVWVGHNFMSFVHPRFVHALYHSHDIDMPIRNDMHRSLYDLWRQTNGIATGTSRSGA